jgi:hypothetical protein
MKTYSIVSTESIPELCRLFASPVVVLFLNHHDAISAVGERGCDENFVARRGVRE